MTHPNEETLNDFIERDLTPAEHVRVAAHIETCPDCALFVADMQQIVRDASALGPLAPPPHVWTAIQSRLDSAQPKAHSPQPKVWMRFAWAAATAALVVMAFLTGRFVDLREQQSASQDAATSRLAVADQAMV